MELEKIIKEYIEDVIADKIVVYNEFSLQHELGIYLREKLADYKVQFERNAKDFGISDTVKHEIDIVVFNDEEKYAIELKYPQKGQYPEQMFSFVKDIKFMEELKAAGFKKTYCLTLVSDKNYYSASDKKNNKKTGIYAYFRENQPIQGSIVKPTGKKDKQIQINGSYTIQWKPEPSGEKAYYLCCIL